MHVGIDVKCMHTDFGGHGLIGFGDKISLWFIKVEIFPQSESAQKNVCKEGLTSRACMPVLVGVAPPVSEIWLPFKNGQISLLGHGL